jgi:hypothetical protein
MVNQIPDKLSRSQRSGDLPSGVAAKRKSRFSGELQIKYLLMSLRSVLFVKSKEYQSEP